MLCAYGVAGMGKALEPGWHGQAEEEARPGAGDAGDERGSCECRGRRALDASTGKRRARHGAVEASKFCPKIETQNSTDIQNIQSRTPKKH